MILIIISLMMAANGNSKVIFDFTRTKEGGNWVVINDGVMGGLSKGSLVPGESGTAIFSGTVSLENNGGFSSVRYSPGKMKVEDFSTLELHLKGDGKKYQVRIREKSNDYYSYIYPFQTSGKWETIKVPLAEMYPSFRGRTLNLPNYPGKTLTELSFLIGNKKEESFRLELQKAVLK